MKQMETEFGLVKNSDVAGKDVLIVDDVMTTGATLASAARVLKNAGAKSVSAIVFAQKI
jgi:predicted amidophosphoribosyltransferase